MAKPTVVIIAGGANSRFFPFQSLGPKGNFTIMGKSLFARMLENLHEHQFLKIVCVITPSDAENKLTQTIVESTKLPLEVSYVIQPEPRGMGDATLLGTAQLSDEEKKRFAVTSAYQLSAGEMLDQMMARGEGTVLSSSTTPAPSEYGIFSFNEAGHATNIIEKPPVGTEPSDQKILTLNLFDSAFLEQLKNTPPAEFNFETALAQVLQKQPAPVLKLTDIQPSLKYSWSLLDITKMLLKKVTSYRAPSAQIAATALIDETNGPVYIGENAKVGHAAHIAGPCYIGNDVIIGDFVLVRESAIEKAVHLGCFTEVARCGIGEGTHFHSGYLGDSIIGPNCRFGAGFVSGNKRLDRKTIGVKIKEKMVDSGLTQFGILVGEKAQIGIHVSTMPGKLIGPNAVVYPNQSVNENVLTELKPTT